MSASSKAKIFEQKAAEQVPSTEKNAPVSVSTKGGRVGWNDSNNQVRTTLQMAFKHIFKNEYQIE